MLPGMRTFDAERIRRAEQFLWISARVLERLRFEHLFRAGPREPVLSALDAYRNRDGGYGHAIEPDFRGPVSQPLGALSALGVLDEVAACDASHVAGLLGHLTEISAADGGVPNVLPNAGAYPRAPWWQPSPLPTSGCLLPTAALAGLAHKHRLRHAWLERATDYCWRAIEELFGRVRVAASDDRLARLQAAYEARSVVTFLDHVPDRTRATQQAEALGRVLLQAKLINLEPDANAEAAQPLDFAASPKSVACSWFSEGLLARHVDALIDSQASDGGYVVPWLIWTPITGLEWRGIQTFERLKTLHAYGRIRSD
jgi:hypothetical protein